jgi:hypothetical protein
MNFKISGLASALAVVLLSACGGGGGGGTNVASTIGGVAIDGYLGGAKVCVDLNLNFKCDANEPFAMTKEDGTYSISWSGGDAAGLVVITETLPTTKDTDDNGKSFADVGRDPFILAAPVPVGATNDIKITPLTTMITVDALPQDNDTNKRLDTTAVINAANAIKAGFGMDAAKDPLKLDVAQDAAAKPIAQLISHKLGGIQSAATGEMSAEKMKSAVVTAKNSTVGMLENGALPERVTVALAKNPDARVAALNEIPAIKGTIDSAALVINKGSSNFDVKQALVNGLVISNFDNGYHPLDAQGGIGNWKPGKVLNVEFLKFGANQITGSEVRRVLDNGWVKEAEWDSAHYLGPNGKWIKEAPFGSPEQTFEFSGNCVISKMPSLLATSTQFCFSAKVLDGLTISKLNPSYCPPKGNGATPEPTPCDQATFKTGSKGYELTVSVVDADEYRINIPNMADDLRLHYGNGTHGFQTTTNITDFIKELNDKKSDTSLVIPIWDGFAINIKSYDGKSNGVFNWYSRGQSLKPAGEGSFEIKKVNGVDLLVFKPSTNYHKMIPGEMVGRDFVFAAKDNRIWLGRVSYKDVKRQFNLNGYAWFGNREFLESMLEGWSLPPFPFDGN